MMTCASQSLPVTTGGSTEADLRARVALTRRQLDEATDAFRQAAARHDAAHAIPLLRMRSSLMRQLLECQCQLLLALRVEN